MWTFLRTFAAALASAMCVIVPSVAAQTTPPAAPDSQRVPSARQAAPPAAPDSQRVLFAGYGDVQTRSEWDRPMAASPSDFFTLMRSRLGVRITPSEGVTIVMQAQDSRVLGDASAAARQSFDLHQGYLQLTNPLGAHTLMLRAGRQEIILANERLVGALGWTNFGRAFDGMRVSLSPSGAAATRWSADLFGTTIEERGRHFGPDRSAPKEDHILAGAFLTRALDASGNARAEFTALLDVGSDYRVYRNARRSTFDLRVRHPNARGLRIEAEGALQVGAQQVVDGDALRDQSVRGWLAGLRLGTVMTAKSRGGVLLGADLLSGDLDAKDGTYSGFSTLYGTNHPFYGLIDLFLDPAGVTRERGLRDLFLHGDVRINARMRLHGELHRIQLATGTGRDIGWEVDAVLPVTLNEQTRIELGYSAFRAGSDAPSIGFGAPGRVQQWAYVQLRTAFQR